MESKDTFANVERLVRNAWDFLVPPTIRVAIALAVLLLFVPAARPPSNKLRVDDASVDKFIATLDRLELTSVIPIGTLVLVVVTAYAVNQLMVAIGSLIPVQVSLHELTAIGDNPTFVKLWGRHPEIKNPKEMLSFAEKLVGEPDPESNKSAVRKAAQLAAKAKRAEFNESFVKFLMLWALLAAVLATLQSASVAQTWLTLALILPLLAVLLALSFGHQARIKREQLIARVEAAFSLEDRDAKHATDEQKKRVDEYLEEHEKTAARGWWTIKQSPTPLLKFFSGYSRRLST